MILASFSTGWGAEPVVGAIKHMDERPRSGWAFVRTVEAADQTQVARYDPRRENARHGWTLERIDGKPPNPKQVAGFNQQVDQTHERITDANAPTRVAALVDLDSLALVTTNQAGCLLYSFAPTLGNMPAEQRKLMAGALEFNPTQQQIVSLSVRSTRPYSPKFSVKITTFEMRMIFEPVDGYVVPTEMTTRLQGKAFLKPVNEEIRISFTDYEWTHP